MKQGPTHGRWYFRGTALFDNLAYRATKRDALTHLPQPTSTPYNVTGFRGVAFRIGSGILERGGNKMKWDQRELDACAANFLLQLKSEQPELFGAELRLVEEEKDNRTGVIILECYSVTDSDLRRFSRF